MTRLITVEELPLIYPIGHAIWAEGKLPGDYVESAFLKSWTGFYKTGCGQIFGAFKGTQLIGALGGVFYPDPNDGKLVSVEAFWYVFKEHRNTSGAGVRLLLDYEQWALEHGVARITMANLVTLNDEAMVALYARMGYVPLDRTYVKEIA